MTFHAAEVKRYGGQGVDIVAIEEKKPPDPQAKKNKNPVGTAAKRL